MPSARANGITIEYDSFGLEGCESILLISGLGMQMIRWAVSFCELLAEQGYRVIRFDNRDAGLSTHFTDSPTPDFAAIARAVAQGQRPAVPYTLHDMAEDLIGLLDALSIDRAHLVGRSMGGMIAQLVASEHPHRTLSLTSIMSSTGNPDMPSATSEVMAMLTQPAPHPSKDETGFLAHSVAFARMISSPGYPFDEAIQRGRILAEVRRAYNPAGFGRQIAAIAATGDLRARLATIAIPTLVVHGSDDPLIPVACGKDTAANIKGADLMIIEGMGHDLPPALYETVAAAIVRNTRREQSSLAGSN
jgi:pimeloyl-ACP methyl ester carboxylesterase